MAKLYTLDGVSFDDGGEVDQTFERWRLAIENANNWNPTGDILFEAGADTGFAISVKRRNSDNKAAVAAIGGITAAPDDDTLGEGDATIRENRGADLVGATRTVHVYSNFTVAIPAGTRLVIAPYKADWIVVGANCPTTGV